ncbi:uncharacterized protein LOC115067226 isoform X10 [Nannospalax galili]|uniref:uncharacterized protein LOC115067226 isoform X10 n=1 Tax=Nannospalax galili TaxID=1026970 RepID=UPI00111C0F14|nr:uncharacterized protein LOC115067226 isoform X10 [Nannospalax galili]
MQLKDDSKKDYQEIRLAVYPGVTVLEDGGLAYPTASDPAEQRPPLTIWPNRASETHSLSFTWDPTMPHYVHRVWNEGFMSQLGKHQLRLVNNKQKFLVTWSPDLRKNCSIAKVSGRKTLPHHGRPKEEAAWLTRRKRKEGKCWQGL